MARRQARARGAGVEQGAREHRDLDFVLGTWVEDAAVDQALAKQRTVDRDLWK